MMEGNIIYVGGDYIAGISDTFGAKLHRHPLIEVYAACDGDGHVAAGARGLRGGLIVIGPDAPHSIADAGKPGVALFLDPLTASGYSLWRRALGGEAVRSLPVDGSLQERLRALPEAGPDKALQGVCEGILAALGGDPVERPFSASVLRAIDLMAEESCDFDMDALAGKVFLSKSRLAHVFSGETGITLKEYLQYKRLESACRKMLSGMNITEAAYDTGFSGSSHIASSSIKLTGLQLKKLLNL